MGYKHAAVQPSIPLDVFRAQIHQFKKAHIIPQYDDIFEKDAVISALKRIHPGMQMTQILWQADMVIHDRMITPKVTPDDVRYALGRMRVRHASIRYGIVYALKQLRIMLVAVLRSRIPTYGKMVIEKYQGGMIHQLIRQRNSYFSLFRSA